MPTTARPARPARTGLAALAGLALALSGAGVAGAAQPAAATDGTDRADRAAPARGSLVFIRDHDVWVARGDGTGARAVTTDGTVRSGYGSPSQADNGTIVAQRGQRIVRLSPAGRVLGRIDPQPVPNGLGHLIDGIPVELDISPDGRRVAYTFTSFECDSVAGCYQRFATGVTRSDYGSDPVGESTRNSPVWITNNRLLLGGGGGISIHLQTVGSAETRWFADSDTGGDGGEDLSEPVLSPDGRYLAAVRGYGGGTHIAWYDVSGDPRGSTPVAPSRKCFTSHDPSLGGPAFSAGGTLAWEEGTDLWATSDPSSCAHQPEVFVRNAQQPSFSSWTYRVPAPENTVRPAVAGTAQVGRRLTARVGTWTPRPTSYAYQWLRGTTPIRGATRATYVPTRLDGGRRVTVRVVARGPGGTGAAVAPGRVVRR